MKKILLFLICLLGISWMRATDRTFIKIETNKTSLIYRVADDGRLYQCYLGEILTHDTDLLHLPQGTEAYLTHGMEDYFEPAIRVLHNDGNPSLLLKYVSHEQTMIMPDVCETIITLKVFVFRG